MDSTNYKDVLNQVNSFKSGVELLAVSKRFPYERVLSAYSDGARLFGENRVQEAESKYPIERPEGMKVYLIGHLQKNKAKKAALLFDRIESIDSIELLEILSNQAERLNRRLDVLLELNISGEESKSGFDTKDDLLRALDYSKDLSGVKVRGLMGVGPLTDDKERIRESFRSLSSFYNDIKSEYNLDVLSMGMSFDWRIAVECGSTEVRIGTLIFGQRP